MAGKIQLKFQVQDYAAFNMARCDRKERLNTNERDRERGGKNGGRKREKRKSEKKKERMNGGRRQKKIPLQMWLILAHCRPRQTTIVPTRVQTAVCTRVLMREVSF